MRSNQHPRLTELSREYAVVPPFPIAPGQDRLNMR